MFGEGSARREVFQRTSGCPEGVTWVFRECFGGVPGLFLKKPMQSNQFGQERIS